MRKRNRLLCLHAFGAALVLLFATLARGAEPACPASIDVKQELVKPPAGWSAWAEPGPLRLDNVAFFDGPPEERATLVYDSEIKGKGTWTAIWKFPAGNPRPFFVGCRYLGTQVLLNRKLSSETRECRVTYKEPGTIFQSMSCK